MAVTPMRSQNKGGGKGKRKRKPDGPSLGDLARLGTRKQIRKRAQRDVRWAQRPALKDLERQHREAKRMYESDERKVGNIYDRLQSQLAPLGEQYDEQAQGIMRDYTGQVGGLANLIGQATLPEFSGETQAAGGMLGSLGAGGLAMLGSDRMRNAGYQRFAGQQAAFEGAESQRMLLQGYREMIDELRAQRQDIKRDAPLMSQQRLAELMDTRFERMLALREMNIRKKLADREFGFRKRQVKRERKDERKKDQWAKNEIERERRRQRRRKEKRQDRQITQRIRNTRDRLQALNKEIDKWEAMGNDPFARDKLADLYKRREALQKRIEELEGKRD